MHISIDDSSRQACAAIVRRLQKQQRTQIRKDHAPCLGSNGKRKECHGRRCTRPRARRRPCYSLCLQLLSGPGTWSLPIFVRCWFSKNYGRCRMSLNSSALSFVSFSLSLSPSLGFCDIGHHSCRGLFRILLKTTLMHTY